MTDEQFEEMMEIQKHISAQLDLMHQTNYEYHMPIEFIVVCVGLMAMLAMFYVGMTLVRGR